MYPSNLCNSRTSSTKILINFSKYLIKSFFKYLKATYQLTETIKLVSITLSDLICCLELRPIYIRPQVHFTRRFSIINSSHSLPFAHSCANNY